MDLDRIAVDLSEDVEQVTGVEPDLEPVRSIIGRDLFGGDTILGRGNRKRNLVAVDAHLDGTSLFAGDG